MMTKISNKKVIRGISLVLAILMIMSTMVALVGCGKKEETDTKTVATATPVPTTEANNKNTGSAEPTVEPTAEPTAEPDNISDGQKEIDDKLAEITPAPVADEKLPTLAELVKKNKEAGHRLSDNITGTMDFGYTVSTETREGTASIKIAANVESKSYDNTSYTKTHMYMDVDGDVEERTDEEYKIIDKQAGTLVRYTLNETADCWYYSKSAYFEADTDDSMFGDEVSIADNLTDVVITADNSYYYVTGHAVAGTDTDAASIADTFGITGTDTVTNWNLKFDRTTFKIESVEVVCEFGEVYTEENTKVNADKLVITMRPNYEKVTVPAEIVKNAVVLSEVEVTDTDKNTEREPQKGTPVSVHEGWSEYYDDYIDETGNFTMTYGKDNKEIAVTLNGKDNWFYNNQWSFGTYLAVRDDSINDSGPAAEILYADSNIKVNNTNNERALVYLLGADYMEDKTSADIVPIIVNDRQGYYLTIYESDWSREIVALQDVGFNTYVSIHIDTKDTKTETLKLVETYLLNFVYTE